MSINTISAFGAGTWSSEHGEFISDAHRRLAELVNQYNPNLHVAHIPRAKQDEMEKYPFAIIEIRQGFEPVVIRYLTEVAMQDPASVLAWIFEGDVIRHGGKEVLNRIELRERAERMTKLALWKEQAEDREQELAFMVSGGRNKLHTIKHNGKKFER